MASSSATFTFRNWTIHVRGNPVYGAARAPSHDVAAATSLTASNATQ